MAQDFVGTKRWVRPATPYEIYMEEQNLPIHRGTVGFYDIRDLTLSSWQRMGAQGAFIELNGCGGLQGMYVIEVPGAMPTLVGPWMLAISEQVILVSSVSFPSLIAAKVR